MDFELLQNLCAIPGTSGDELDIRNFLLQYIEDHKYSWKIQPEIWAGDGFQDNIGLIFGKPTIGFYAHIDTVGFTVRYDNYVIPIGGIDAKTGDCLVFEKEGKSLETRLIFEEENEFIMVDAHLPIVPGTALSYRPDFEIADSYIKSPYLDDRLGVLSLLELAKTAENIAIVFTTYEELGGGAAGYLARILFEKYQVSKAIIADVTWITNGVHFGKGPVISLRDSRIPRKVFVDEIRKIAKHAGIPFQLEVEAQGGSDGREIQHLPYPIDWCFVGPPSENAHSALEIVHQKDAEAFVSLLQVLALHL